MLVLPTICKSLSIWFSMMSNISSPFFPLGNSHWRVLPSYFKWFLCFYRPAPKFLFWDFPSLSTGTTRLENALFPKFHIFFFLGMFSCLGREHIHSILRKLQEKCLRFSFLKNVLIKHILLSQNLIFSLSIVRLFLFIFKCLLNVILIFSLLYITCCIVLLSSLLK